MQTLFFQPAWDQTIAPADREKITHLFQSLHFKDGIHFSFLWEAVNYKEERLVTVLLHNVEDTPLKLANIAIDYLKDKQAMTGLFTLPLQVPERTTMPWTFIFSSDNQTDQLPAYTIVYNE
ncbi:SLAP domain-containing protein [Sporosarcina pasteurii]|uniref:SLAP domain-containing protein n=1 Tax=Sporosarcina pasteurii TaxID=1474 RepID=A0A380CED1_SPOPA|nr:SLAP domain-containing protein [Sporosarcina pasteurii]MDS9473189.1 SLAP domain-containing protein [Sporosarcina pasteurii]QBQ06922.1 SLAP domain-containing protein [Sporosarcina pasteurii]SUJ19033.1 Uncharacterised protein [Sporosarcina pasteurii]